MWRLGKLEALIALCFASSSTCAWAATPLEQQVLAALNLARTDPRGYAESLKKFKTYFHQATYTLPGSAEDVVTEEGIAVVDETIGFLAQQTPLAPVAPAEILGRAAVMLTADQGASGITGHEGSDGSSPGDRTQKVGGGDYVAEVIAYGPVDAADAIRQLIVDDGVSDRGHRSVIFSPDLRFAGVSCGPHKEYKTMCVVDLAVTADGKFAHEMRLARVDLPGRGTGN